MFGVPVFRCSGVPVFRCSDVPMFRCSGVPVFRCSDVSVFRCSGVPVFRCSGIPVFLLLLHAEIEGDSENNPRPLFFLVGWLKLPVKVLLRFEIT